MLTTATLPYLALLLLSLLAGVYAMLFGVNASSPDERPSRLRRSLPGLAVAGMGAAIVGYLLTRQEAMASTAILLVTLGIGVVLFILATWFLHRWALSAEIDPATEIAEELQGTLAQVVRDIRPTAVGEIRYELHGKRYSAAARSIEGTSIPAGTDVVIDRIEQGVASVEPWAVVEQRI
jgi:membrane protein implicated in regulation of membrane protease activity